MQELHYFIDSARQCTNTNELSKLSHEFTIQSGFKHFFILNSYFDNYSSPKTQVLTNYCKTPKYRRSIAFHSMLEELIDNCLNSVTPVIHGKLRNSSLHKDRLPNTIKHINKHNLHSSISFPVHSPAGHFSMFHIGCHAHNEIHYRAILAYGFYFAVTVCDRLNKLTESPFDNFNLSAREKSCLLLACDGISPRTSSTQLGLSIHTVQHYLKSARKKMRCKNLQLALSQAINQGIITPSFSHEADEH